VVVVVVVVMMMVYFLSLSTFPGKIIYFWHDRPS
jgi:hypothetical protein